ncbi:MAG: polysaccharide export protein [Acidobacteria bacterium]|nr:polysaccharide export protein [Acidobacteriota bacterium]
MTIRVIGVLLMVLACVRAGSAQEPQKADTTATSTPMADPDVRKSAGAPVDPRTYIIGAEDVLAIRVWKEPDASGLVTVRPDGKVTLALGGDVQASGLTPEQLGKKITETLSSYINRPQVTVMVQAVYSKKYYISGEVGRPGAFPLVVPTTVVEALTQSGGFREFANQKKIIIMRGAKRMTFNYKDYIRGKGLDKNIQLENGDHIVVQ